MVRVLGPTILGPLTTSCQVPPTRRCCLLIVRATRGEATDPRADRGARDGGNPRGWVESLRGAPRPYPHVTLTRTAADPPVWVVTVHRHSYLRMPPSNAPKPQLSDTAWDDFMPLALMRASVRAYRLCF